MRRKGTICCGCRRLRRSDDSPHTPVEQKTGRENTLVSCKCLDVSKIRKLRLMVCLCFLTGVCTVVRFNNSPCLSVLVQEIFNFRP